MFVVVVVVEGVVTDTLVVRACSAPIHFVQTFVSLSLSLHNLSFFLSFFLSFHTQFLLLELGCFAGMLCTVVDCLFLVWYEGFDDRHSKTLRIGGHRENFKVLDNHLLWSISTESRWVWCDALGEEEEEVLLLLLLLLLWSPQAGISMWGWEEWRICRLDWSEPMSVTVRNRSFSTASRFSEDSKSPQWMPASSIA